MSLSSAPTAALEYPFAAPQRGQAVQVAAGVHWIRLPLPFALDHVNAWMIEDGDAWAVVDTGTCSDEMAALWRKLLASMGGRGDVTRVFVTHMHPDHVGMAGWMTQTFGVQLWMSRAEYLSCRVTVSVSAHQASADVLEFYRRAGWSHDAISSRSARDANFARLVHALPQSFRRLQDGQVLRIGAHAWRVIVGQGHSPEHACLYCPDLRLLISGDQVLPRISSNVSVYPSEPDADPMAEWLASLDKLQREVPDDVLVLPAHNECFRGLHARLDALRAGQQRALARLRDALVEPKRAVDVFGALFGRPIRESDVMLLGLATGESVAYLNYLLHCGEARCDVDEQGVAWYRRVE